MSVHDPASSATAFRRRGLFRHKPRPCRARKCRRLHRPALILVLPHMASEHGSAACSALTIATLAPSLS